MIVSSFNLRGIAATMHQVAEDAVTPDMLRLARMVRFSQLNANTAASFDRHWKDCPDCKQSACARYAGKLGCTRCGWTEGQFVRKLSQLF